MITELSFFNENKSQSETGTHTKPILDVLLAVFFL